MPLTSFKLSLLLAILYPCSRVRAALSGPSSWVPSSRTLCTSSTSSPRKRSTELALLESSEFVLGDDPFESWWLPPSLGTVEDEAQHDEIKKARFATGQELRNLRADIESNQENLKWSKATGDQDRIKALTQAIKNGEERDAELVYARASKAIQNATKLPHKDVQLHLIEKLLDDMKEARKVIPRFNLEGLWVGKYGANDVQLINVTYDGETLVATKVTGDRNVPRGEVTFKADLSPREELPKSDPNLEPIEISAKAADKWGMDKLKRYPGDGHIASADFKKRAVVKGQLVMYDAQFSFIWIPSARHILFARPSPGMTLHLLRDIYSKEDELDNMREHLTRCFNMDSSSPIKLRTEPFKRISTVSDLKALQNQEPLERQSRRFSFWHIDTWKNYISSVLDANEED